MAFRDSYVSGKEAKIEIRSAQDNSIKVELPAFLTTFTNSFNSAWSEEQVYGRIDPIGTFQGTKRRINLGFNIIAYNEDDARANITALNTITHMLYPSYSDVSELNGGTSRNGNALILSKSPLVEIKFGNLISDQSGKDKFLLGWISSWSANPVLEMGMLTPKPGEFLPKVYNATLDFTPQHRSDLAFNSKEAIKAKFPYDGGK